jgi:hypothetical protein
MAATKFWPINGTGSYVPESNPQVLIQGTVGTTGIDGVAASDVTAINALGATNVKITELGIWVASAASTSIVFASAYAGATGVRQVNYCNAQRPAFGIDGPVSAILVTDATPNDLVIIDNGGKTATFPAGSLKQGAIYPIQINTVVSATSGDFIGLSEY